MRALALLFVIACSDEAVVPERPQAKPEVDTRRAADLAEGVTTELDTATAAFGDGVLAELMGDLGAARTAFERVLASTESPPHVAARAALHLAQIFAGDGKHRDAVDLVARAEAFAPNDLAITRAAKQVRIALASAGGTGEVRGPRPGTPLNVDPKVAEAFAQADRRLVAVHRMKVEPTFTLLYRDLIARENATESLVAKYRSIAEAGGLAAVAAHFRAGTLHHDFATTLFGVRMPQELDEEARVIPRARYTARAWANLEKAVGEYQAALAVPAAREAGELWRVAAEEELRRAKALLDARGK